MFLRREDPDYLDCMAEAIKLVTRRGLGDALVCLPTLYALAARGHQVDLVCEGEGPQWGHILPLPIALYQGEGAQTLDVTQSRLFYWSGIYPLVDTVAGTCGIELEPGMPRAPWLPKPPPVRKAGSYLVICMEGSTGHRALNAEQITGAVAATPAGLEAVVTHTSPREIPCGEDLTGQTTAEQWISLIAHARAVVAADGGGLHLAAAFGTPLVAVVAPRTINPHALARDWQPSWWLSGDFTYEIPGAAVGEALRQVLETIPARVKAPRCGAAWWQSAATQSRMATAAAHQERIDACAKSTT